MLFAHQRSSCRLGCSSSAGLRVRNDADPEVGFDGVGEAETVADNGAVLWGPQADVEFVFA